VAISGPAGDVIAFAESHGLGVGMRPVTADGLVTKQMGVVRLALRAMSGGWEAILPAGQRRELDDLTARLDLDHGDRHATLSGFWTMLVLSAVIAVGASWATRRPPSSGP
jgi:hypothetical protein